jgi:hypothetical protein
MDETRKRPTQEPARAGITGKTRRYVSSAPTEEVLANDLTIPYIDIPCRIATGQLAHLSPDPSRIPVHTVYNYLRILNTV